MAQCKLCKHDPNPVVAEYSFYIKPGNGMMYNIECQVRKSDDNFETFEATTKDSELVGYGGDEETAAKHLQSLLSGY